MPLTRHFLVLLSGTGLAAQDPAGDPKAITEALASPKPAAVAWAAHHARALGDRTLIVPLQRALATWREDPSLEARCAIQHVLDALIEQNAKVPATELLPLLDDPLCGTAAFVLLAQHPQQNEAELLQLFRDLPPATGKSEEEQRLLRTRAIGNLLCAQRTPGFARLVWQRLGFALHVEVQEPGASVVHSISYSRPPRSDTIPEGFPPASILRLANKSEPVRSFLSNQREPKVLTLLADGPTPVYFGRIGAEAKNVMMWASDQPDHLAWLRQLGQPGIPEPFRVIQVLGVDATAYLAAIDEARTKLRTYKETLRRDLVARKALTEADAAELSTEVEVIVVDKRKDKGKPLPEIPAR